MEDTKLEPGCGWTQQPLMDQLITMAAKQYEEGLLRVGVKPTKRQALVDGYRDGMRAAIHHLEGMGVMTVFPGGPDPLCMLRPDDDEVES